MKETIVMSLGGSLINSGKIDVPFLKKFRDMIIHLLPKYNFVIVTGGGSVCREYNKAADKLNPNVEHEEKDWMGTYVTTVNAQLVKIMFGDFAAGIYMNPTENPRTHKQIIIGSGWKPGFSSDFDAVMWAKTRKARTVINLTDVDYIYTADLDFDKNAKPIKSLTWEGFKKLIGGEWVPGMNVPFDPIASKEAQRTGIKVIIVNGKNLKNLKACLSGNDFRGTVIADYLE